MLCNLLLTSALPVADAAMPALVKLLKDIIHPRGRIQAAQTLGRLAEDDELRKPVTGTPSWL